MPQPKKTKKIAPKKTTPVKYRLSGIAMDEFNFTNPKQNFDIKNVRVDYNINPEVKYDVEKSSVYISFTILGAIQETNEICVKCKCIFVFFVKDLKEITYVENNFCRFKDTENEKVIHTFLGVSFSTMRGIMFSKLMGTIFSSSPLPITDPRDFYKIN